MNVVPSEAMKPGAPRVLGFWLPVSAPEDSEEVGAEGG